VAPGVYFSQAVWAARNVCEWTSMPESAASFGIKPLASGSGKLVTLWTRMHFEYSNALELPDPPDEPDELDDPSDEGCGSVVAVGAVGTVEADEAVVPMWAPELGDPPPHADKPKVTAAAAKIKGADSRDRSGRLLCAIPPALSERSSLPLICPVLGRRGTSLPQVAWMNRQAGWVTAAGP
jgi:hypothetical protein